VSVPSSTPVEDGTDTDNRYSDAGEIPRRQFFISTEKSNFLKRISNKKPVA
jgi:hypothetical protein